MKLPTEKAALQESVLASLMKDSPVPDWLRALELEPCEAWELYQVWFSSQGGN